jgi:glycosyltransferase involved in cell wall biosynthesis
MPKNLLFIDPVTPSPYSLLDARSRALGGTEATALRVVKGLADRGHTLHLQQRGREHIELDSSIVFTGIKPDKTLSFDTVITLRDAGFYFKAMESYPNAKHYLWMHDVVSTEYTEHMMMHLKSSPERNLIAVSHWHKSQIHQALPDLKLNIKVIYNPLAPYCMRTETQYDPYKLVFMSSPHKGLEYVIRLFYDLKKVDQRYTLTLANPGYYPNSKYPSDDSIINLGAISHEAIIEELRTSLCLFYPQVSFEETFGLVMAEANAVGTPVIAHRLGAASEVLNHPRQIINCKDKNLVIQTVMEWSQGRRLIVKGNKDFSLGNVIREWERIL